MDRLRLFPTEIFVFRVEGVEPLNEALRQALLAERATHPGVRASEAGGWHSTPDLSQRQGPFRALMELIVDHVGFCVRGLAADRELEIPPHRWSVQAWAIVLDPGGYNILHDHAEAHWSVAWYVDAGDAGAHPDSGALAFVDPRRATQNIPGLDLSPSTFTLRPEAGMLVVFPGALQHYVHPYRGTRPRIVVSANLKLSVQPPGSALGQQ